VFAPTDLKESWQRLENRSAQAHPVSVLAEVMNHCAGAKGWIVRAVQILNWTQRGSGNRRCNRPQRAIASRPNGRSSKPRAEWHRERLAPRSPLASSRRPQSAPGGATYCALVISAVLLEITCANLDVDTRTKMPLLWAIAAALLLSLGKPVPINLRFFLPSSTASPQDLERVQSAFRRGFYSDSLVVPPAETLRYSRGVMPPYDSAARARTGTTVVVLGAVDTVQNRIEFRFRMANILTQPLTPPETLRVSRAFIESVLAEAGHRYAVILAQRFSRRGR